MLPRIQVLQLVSLDLLVRTFLGSKLVDKVVFLLLLQNSQSTFQKLLNELSGNRSLLLQFIIFYFFGMVA